MKNNALKILAAIIRGFMAFGLFSFYATVGILLAYTVYKTFYLFGMALISIFI